MDKFCTECGTSVTPGERFCTGCGHALASGGLGQAEAASVLTVTLGGDDSVVVSRSWACTRGAGSVPPCLRSCATPG